MKKFQTRLSILLCLSLIISSILGWLPAVSSYTTAKAAAKPSINSYSKDKKIGVQGTTEYIYLDNIQSGAKYTFTSSDKSVVKVAADKNYPDYARLTGLKTGAATITVNQVYKGKTTKVGTTKVTVKNAIVNKAASVEVPLGKPNWSYSLANDYYINYMNYKAKYTFTSTDKSALDITAKGIIKNAKKAGKVKVKVTETYKKKKRNVGTLTVKIVAPTLIAKKQTVSQDTFYPSDWVKNGYGHTFVLKATDSSGNDCTDCLLKVKPAYTGGPVGYEWDGEEGKYTVSVYDQTTDLDLGTITLKVSFYEEEDDEDWDTDLEDENDGNFGDDDNFDDYDDSDDYE